MTAAQLVKSLSEEIREATTGIKFRAEYPAADVSVNVFEQTLPYEAFETTSYLPFVCVEWLETTDDLKAGAQMQIGLTLATYAPDELGWMDALHLMETIRLHLLKRRLVAKKFRLVGSIDWEQPQEQPQDFYFVLATLTYSALLAQEVF